MAVRSTPLAIAAGCYTDVDLRAYYAILGGACAAGGVRRITGGEMLVTAPGGMNVAVAVGTAWVPGTDAAGQGNYLADNPTSTTVAVTAANPSNPRIDRVVADINDPAYTGSGSPVFTLQVIAGTPAGSPVAPATPASAISLATVAVAAGAVAIVAGNITDTRPFCDSPTDDFIGLRARRVAAQTLVNGAEAAISWDTEDSDNFGMIAVPSPTITFRLDGTYTISYFYTGFMSSTRFSEMGFSPALPSTNARHVWPIPPSTSLTGVCSWGPHFVPAGTTMSIFEQQTSGSDRTMTGALTITRICA